jgi:hypothetical protein
LSSVFWMIAMTSGGVSFGLTASILAASPATCGDAIATSPRFSALLMQARAGWLDAVSSALREHRVSVATAPVQSLLRRGGIADQLASRGFLVEAPTTD